MVEAGARGASPATDRAARRLRGQNETRVRRRRAHVRRDGGDAVRGVAVYRINENTFEGLHLYVDDLVTDEKLRSRGVGHALMEHLRELARAADCEACTLDSGTQRTRAHKFYFREEMVVSSFHFRKPLK